MSLRMASASRVLGHVCGNETRSHSVHGDATAGELFGGAAGETDDARFGGGVVGLSCVAHQPNNGGDVE